MKILVVCHEFPPVGGGGSRAVLPLVREWAREHHVDYITERAVGLPAQECVGGVRVHRVFSLGRDNLDVPPARSHLVYPVSGLLCGLRMLRRTRYDVINSHFAVPSGFLGTILARIGRVPHVVSIHGSAIYDPCRAISPHRFRPLGAIVKRVLRGASLIVAQSRDTAGNACRYYGASLRDKIRVIPLPFDADEATRLAGRGSGGHGSDAGRDGHCLVSVGRLVGRKGFDRLIRSMRYLPDSVRLVIIGSGPLRGELEDLLRREGLENRVFLVGRVDEVTKYHYLSSADIYVLPSHHEGFGVVLQEAMAAGLPIVAHAHGGQTDVVEDGVNGILTPDNEPATLAAAARRLLDDPAMRRRMAERNREKVREYAPAKIAAEYLAVFREVARRAPIGR